MSFPNFGANNGTRVSWPTYLYTATPQGYPPLIRNPAGQRSTQRYPKSRKRNSMNQFRQPNGFDLILPDPRPFNELYCERNYIQHQLQQEDVKAIDLLRRAAALKETLALYEEGQAHRRAKKQLTWIERRIQESSRQEKTMLARLGQITHAIQSRLRWHHVEEERRNHEQQIDAHLSLHWQMQQQIQFNPFAEFYSHGQMPSYSPQHPIRAEAFWQESAHACELPVPPFNKEEMPSSYVSDNDWKENAMRSQSHVSMNDAKFDLLATNTPHVALPREKRHSLPELRVTNVWQTEIDRMKEEKENTSYDEYVGYYKG